MDRMRAAVLAVFAVMLFAAMAGCEPVSFVPTQEPSMTPTLPAATRTLRPLDTPHPTPLPSLTPTRTITSTAAMSVTPSPSASPTISSSSTPTLTPPASETPTPGPTLFPMSIAAMRAFAYPGSEITVDQELDPGSKYNRYYVYYMSQGLKIYALLTLPQGPPPDGGWPAIVFAHDYFTPADYRTTEDFASYVDRLATARYAVFDIDYRGYGHSEGTDAAGAYGDPGYEVDVLNAIASLKRFNQVNPAKIGMWGQSMGGFLTLRTMVISKDIKAGVIWNGVVAAYPDLLDNWPVGPATPPANARDWMTDWPSEFGTPQQNPGFWESISANTYLSDLSGPLQLHVALGDPIVPPEFSATLAQQIEAVGGTVEINSYSNDDHGLSNNFTTAMDRSVAFFDRYLK